MKITLEDPPEGFSKHAEYRKAEVGEYVMKNNSTFKFESSIDDVSTEDYIVLTKEISRAIEDEWYWFLDENWEVKSTKDKRLEEDNRRYNTGNYFLTSEKAYRFVEEIKEIREEYI